MRFYSLSVVDPVSNKVAFSAGSYPGGIYDPGALNVILDVLTYNFAQPQGGSTITIEGVNPAILSNAQNFAIPNKRFLISLSGGMGAGLPLANPQQAGLLFAGKIYQSFGNWLGTEINLNLVFAASAVTTNVPVGQPAPSLILNWTAGTPLALALKNTFTTAYPGATLKISIADIVLSHDEIGTFDSITTLAQFVNDATSAFASGAVQMTAASNTIRVYDATYKPTPVQLQFTDFIGQPAWISSNVIQVRAVMRADINTSSLILMPTGIQNQPGFVQTTAASNPSMLNYTSNIKGKFSVISVRHIGNLRQPDGNSWCTVINATPVAA